MYRSLLFCLLLTLPFAGISQRAPKQIPGTEGQETHPEAKVNSILPPFQVVTHDGKPFTNANLIKNQPVVFALFNPGCDHCEKIMKEFKSRSDYFSKTNIIFLTFASNFKELSGFIEKTGITNMPNIHVGVAQEKFILNYFMPSYILPQIMVFNAQRKLKTIFYETTQADSVNFYLTKR